MTRIAFVCVGNAGRSQMATAFAEREREHRALDVEIITGGTDPRNHVHEEVIAVLKEEGIDISGREPREITPEDIEDVDYVVTVGCSIDQFRPDGWTGESEQWNLEHPGGDGLDAVRQQRDEIAQRVADIFDELEAEQERTSDS